MGLCLKNNKGDKLNLSYSSFNRMRYMLLSYVCNEEFEKVKKIDFFSKYLQENINKDYLFKFFIEHSDSEGKWNSNEIKILKDQFSNHYEKMKDYQILCDNFDISYDGEMNFKPLIELLEKSENEDILF